MTRPRAPIAADLLALCERFSEWRRTRRTNCRRSPLPEELWSEAVKLNWSTNTGLTPDCTIAAGGLPEHEHLLKQMLPALGAGTGQYTVATVRAAVPEQFRGRRPAYAKTFVGALRIYLRFLATRGVCQPGLDQTLPTVAEWKLCRHCERQACMKSAGHGC